MLRAYFDESEREDGTFCVAGYAFVPHQAKKFEKDWKRAWGERIFHATDFHQGRNHFGKKDPAISAEADRRPFVKASVKLIRRRAAMGSAVAVNLRELERLPRLRQRGFTSAYSICCFFVSLQLGKWAKENGFSSIAYFFESGNEHEAEADDFMRFLSRQPELEEKFCRTSYSFVKKGSVRALESADFLAWEMAKQLHESRNRKSLVELVEGRPSDVVAVLTGESLRAWILDMGRILADVDDDLRPT